MDQRTRDDWAGLVPEAMQMARALPDRVLAPLRDQFMGHAAGEKTAAFIALVDNTAFGPANDHLPQGHFEPLVRRVMPAPKRSIYKAAMAPQAA